MYASIRRYEGIAKETSEEVVRRGHLFRERLSKLPGFVAYEVVVGENSLASITIFETWVTAVESNAMAARWIQENAAGLPLPEPQVTAGEVWEDPGSSHRPFKAPRPAKYREVEPRL